MGAFGGGVLGGAAGLMISTAFGDDPGRNAAAIIALIFLSLWTGTTLGAGLALKLSSDRLASRTTVMVAAGVLTWCVVSVPSLFWALDTAPSHGGGAVLARLGLAAILTIPPALAARWILLANEKLTEREEI